MPLDRSASAPAADLPRSRARRVRRLLHEPLAHFLLIGAALFGLYAIIAPRQFQAPDSRIELTNDDLRQIELAWAAKWRRPPTAAEWRDLVEEQVREEILYREALKMGLDQGDEIVRRRLGQKLEFLMEDVSSLRDPTEADLKAWFSRNASQFALPGRVTFCHVYFSPDRPGQQAGARAKAALIQLQSRPSCSASASVGDRFPDYDYYADRTPEEVASVFGTQFSKAIFQLGPGTWQGPVQSGLGSHLVLIEALRPSHIPAFDEVDRSQIAASWLDEQRSEARRRAFDAMRAKYEIVLPSGQGR